MIFNKTSNGAEELRTLTGSYYASNEFDKVSIKVVLASEQLTNLIGKAIFEKAETHYLGDNYLLEEDPDTEPLETGSGSGSGGSGIPAVNYPLLDQLVQHIQLPIAFLATLWHYQGNDLSHEDSGRKMKIDATSEKIGWQWQYDADDAAAMRNYQKTFDRLIRFLNENAKSFPEWTDSDAKRNLLSLFISTAEQFNSLFAIDDSPVFFLRIAPIMREVERKFIKPILGDKFAELKELIQSGDEITEEDQELIDYVCDPIPLLTMSMAVKRFSLTVIPEGVVQNYFAESEGRKSSKPVTLDMIDAVSKTLKKDGLEILDELKKYYSALITDESDDDISDMYPQQTRRDKFISL
jgi:hypothetical protein